MFKFGFAAIAAVLAAASATAAPVDSSTAFNGPFVGIQGGWQQDEQRLQTTTGAGLVTGSRKNGAGFGYGGQVGYDYRLPGNFVLGAEVAVTGRTSDDGIVDASGNVYDLRLGRTVDATGRAGYVVSATGGLAYVRGGYANARFLLNDAVARNAFNRDGYTVGVGYEQPIARHVSARLEYDYSDYGRGYLGQTAADYGLADARERFRRNAVTAGINIHF